MAAINFIGDDVALEDGKYARVSGIIIDMTNWRTLDKSAQTKGTYPYVIHFEDANGKTQVAYSTEMKSGGLDNMLKVAKDDYRILVTDSTQVKILCPKECMAPSANKQACSCAVRMHELRTKGMDALPFAVTDDDNVDKRLESVLDSAVHYSIISSVCGTRPRTQKGVFEDSIYRYEREDMCHVQNVQEVGREYDPRKFYGPDY